MKSLSSEITKPGFVMAVMSQQDRVAHNKNISFYVYITSSPSTIAVNITLNHESKNIYSRCVFFDFDTLNDFDGMLTEIKEVLDEQGY